MRKILRLPWGSIRLTWVKKSQPQQVLIEVWRRGGNETTMRTMDADLLEALANDEIKQWIAENRSKV